MKISVFGMGYVGLVSAACLLRDGHFVVGVDIADSKVKDLAEGISPIQEPGVAEFINKGYKAGRLKATTNPKEALVDCDMVWVCVGTPSASNGEIDLSAVKTVVQQIGRIVSEQKKRPLIVLRSTCLPGTCQDVVIPLLEQTSNLKVGADIHFVFHPEFLREGSAVEDFKDPPKIVIGQTSLDSADPLLKIYENYKALVFRLSLTEAEMVKYYDNLFHALKITFANELGAIAHLAEVDARKIAEVFCADTKLNISTTYLRPGFAFGGSCLPKDLRAVLKFASSRSLQVPMLQGILKSNTAQIENFVRRILKHQPKTIGIVGLAFKPTTDDMRESPYVTVAKALIDEGIILSIYDPNVDPNRLVGSNSENVQKALGDLRKLMVGSLDDLSAVDLVIIGHTVALDSSIVHRWLEAGIRVLDLIGIEDIDRGTEYYEGIYW